ncbi:transcriptional regulator [Bacteroidia bacterium]|nr:transcriptional regulator [Bacteroidia bacterium]
MEIYEKRLEERNIKPTAIRILILKAMLNYRQAFSMTDLETELDTVDKSTISRTIKLFHDNRLIHSIDDGSGSVKYSVCHSHCNCDIEDQHVHFTCVYCHKTFCLENTAIPTLEIPQSLIPTSVNMVVKGYCANCAKFVF